MNKSSQNLLVAFVAGVGAGIWAGIEFARAKRSTARSPFNRPVNNPWANKEKDEEHKEWLQSLKGKSLEELKQIQQDLLFETDVNAKEIALRRIILAKESEKFDKNFTETAEEIRKTQKETSDRIERFRKEMNSEEI